MASGSVGDDDSRPTKRFKVSSGAILRTLTGVQNVSALTCSTFLGLHLASPIAAALGGSTLAEKTLVSLCNALYYVVACNGRIGRRRTREQG